MEHELIPYRYAIIEIAFIIANLKKINLYTIK